LHIPPLRERKSDIVPLAQHFLKQMAREANLPEISLDKDAAQALKKYAWPGNVRELSNVLERSLSSIEGDTIHLCDLPFYVSRTQKNLPRHNQTTIDIKGVQAQAEKEAIRYALQETKNNKARAAKMLGIHRTLLYKKMKKYNIALTPEL
jgi:DNA-binding NtrC family response regulator